MTLGVLSALAAGLLWGLVFVSPLWLPDHPASLLSVGRYLAFGLIALPLAWFDRRELRRLSARDWGAPSSWPRSAICSTTCAWPPPSNASACRCPR